jgi:hypothetical protein
MYDQQEDIMRSFATTLTFTLLLSGGAAMVLSGGTALAAQNVANTSQKGSLLIWPMINIDPEDSADTFIEISNDANVTVKLECYYVNEKKGRVDFDFHLSGKATASWSVKTQAGDQVQPPRFPRGGSYIPGPGYASASAYRGELVCFAIDADGTHQIAFNHLTGTATVARLADADASQARQASRYNAWSFIARNAAGLPEADRVRQGTPGRLELTGGGAGKYDACPLYNIANFMPNGATLGRLKTLDNDLTVVSCKQDLRQDYGLNLTKLKFTVWNSLESSFTGAYICVDSVNSVALGSAESSPYLVNQSNFEYSTLKTPNARFQVSGVASAQCPGSTTTALLGVLESSISLSGAGGEDQELGSTTHGSGAASGFVLWDPSEPVPLKPAKR